MSARLSVIIPVYKVEAYLDACLASVLGQSLHDIEVILVDDGSPDRCPVMCDDYARRDSRVRVIHKENAGLGYARNTGLDAATAPRVTFLDSDDVVDTDAYERLIALMDEHALDSIRFACNRFKDDGSHSPTTYGQPLFTYDSPDELRELAVSIFGGDMRRGDKPMDCGGSSCMAIFDRGIIERNHLRFLSERDYISEDFIFTYSFYMLARKVGYVADTYYHYRINPKGLTRSVDLDVISRAAHYSRYVEQLMADNGLPQEQAQAARGFYVSKVRDAVKSVFLSTLPLREKVAWFRTQTADAYYREVMATYPASRLTRKQRFIQHFYSRGLFVPSYLITVLFNKLRPDRIN